jgi:hypothetical protein
LRIDKANPWPLACHASQASSWTWLCQQLQSLHIARDGPVSPSAYSPSCAPPGHLSPFRRPTAWSGQARWLADEAAAHAAWLDLAAGLIVCPLLTLGSWISVNLCDRLDQLANFRIGGVCRALQVAPSHLLRRPGPAGDAVRLERPIFSRLSRSQRVHRRPSDQAKRCTGSPRIRSRPHVSKAVVSKALARSTGLHVVPDRGATTVMRLGSRDRGDCVRGGRVKARRPPPPR